VVVRRGVFVSVSVACLGAVVWLGAKPTVPEGRVLAATKAPRQIEHPGYEPVPATQEAEERPHAFRVPTGDAPSLSCESARMIVAQVRKNLAYVPETIAPRAFATSTGDWLDPYGLWSVAPDSPVAIVLERHASDLLADMEGRGSSGSCVAARFVGRALATWASELRAQFERERDASSTEDASAAAGEGVFEGATVTRPARTLAATLARKLHAIERGLGDAGAAYVATAIDRYFPKLDEEQWARVVLAAGVRAYVPLVDPHGAWAPLDEEASVYEVDLESRPPGRLWDKSTRTAIGLRVDSGATAPLKTGDIVLSLAGVATGGMPLEQLEQLGFAASEQRPTASVVVLRAGEKSPRTLVVERTRAPSESARVADAPPASIEAPLEKSGANDEVEAERVAFGDGDALVVPIRDVRDDLGEMLTKSLLREREKREKDGARAVTGVVLDLRGNGGGSTDGAIDALGLFLPGAPLFPMKRRDGTLETDRAPEPPNVDRWNGPVAALVDSDTASAAEMIAGALAAYRRGPVLGTSTFGKGCAQEYLDDAARAGVLRLTTLLYALPDGSPVQRVGLLPTIKVAFAQSVGGAPSRDREALLPHAPPTWRGPDVRDRALVHTGDDPSWLGAWPHHGGSVGPCKDADVCRALRALGAPAPQRVAKGR
jgi:carboxyl-terminal processing protease